MTPWAAIRLLKPDTAHGDTANARTASRASIAASWGRCCTTPPCGWSFLVGVVVLLLGSMALVYIEFVKVKMLPFDNKSEFQVIVDMPEGTTLEQTATRDPRTGRQRDDSTRK